MILSGRKSSANCASNHDEFLTLLEKFSFMGKESKKLLDGFQTTAMSMDGHSQLECLLLTLQTPLLSSPKGKAGSSHTHIAPAPAPTPSTAHMGGRGSS